jgi:hypothetical protein
MFDQYAELKIPSAWTGSRNPVAYTDLQALKIDLEKLDWKPFVPTIPRAVRTSPDSERSSLVDRARTMVAEALSVSPDAVKITVAL